MRVNEIGPIPAIKKTESNFELFLYSQFKDIRKSALQHRSQSRRSSVSNKISVAALQMVPAERCKQQTSIAATQAVPVKCLRSRVITASDKQKILVFRQRWRKTRIFAHARRRFLQVVSAARWRTAPCLHCNAPARCAGKRAPAARRARAPLAHAAHRRPLAHVRPQAPLAMRRGMAAASSPRRISRTARRIRPASPG